MHLQDEILPNHTYIYLTKGNFHLTTDIKPENGEVVVTSINDNYILRYIKYWFLSISLRKVVFLRMSLTLHCIIFLIFTIFLFYILWVNFSLFFFLFLSFKVRGWTVLEGSRIRSEKKWKKKLIGDMWKGYRKLPIWWHFIGLIRDTTFH